MSMVAEFADSAYKRWMGSCLGWIWPEARQPGSPHGPRGVEKEMKICHNQPHLVPPMKLVFYEDMPNSPAPRSSSHLSQLMSEGRNLASRASSRASLTLRKKASRKPTIGAPSDFRRVNLPSGRRLGTFRPLELSIYEPGNRLSDLPEFEDFDFNNSGEIQFPPRALVRARSETLLTQSSDHQIPRKPVASMFGETALNYGRRVSSPLLTDREEESSTPQTSVVWNSLPGLSPRSRSASEPPSRPIRKDLAFTLHPTIEEPAEHIPLPTGDDDDNITLDFPLIEEPLPQRTSSLHHRTLLPSALPSDSVPSLPLKTQQSTAPTTYPAASRHRVSQWLFHSRNPSASTNPATTTSTTHHKPLFYQCTASLPPPSRPSHTHTRTESASTVASTMLSGRDSLSSNTATTMTQLTSGMSPTVRSRGGTMRSVFSKDEDTLRFAVPEKELEALPPAYEARERAEAVGMAF